MPGRINLFLADRRQQEATTGTPRGAPPFSPASPDPRPRAPAARLLAWGTARAPPAPAPGASLDPALCAALARDGRLDALKDAVAKGAPFEKPTRRFEPSTGEIVEGTTCATCAAAAANGHLDVLRYARESGARGTRRRARKPPRAATSECLAYARENGAPGTRGRPPTPPRTDTWSASSTRTRTARRGGRRRAPGPRAAATSSASGTPARSRGASGTRARARAPPPPPGGIWRHCGGRARTARSGTHARPTRRAGGARGVPRVRARANGCEWNEGACEAAAANGRLEASAMAPGAGRAVGTGDDREGREEGGARGGAEVGGGERVSGPHRGRVTPGAREERKRRGRTRGRFERCARGRREVYGSYRRRGLTSPQFSPRPQCKRSPNCKTPLRERFFAASEWWWWWWVLVGPDVSKTNKSDELGAVTRRRDAGPLLRGLCGFDLGPRRSRVRRRPDVSTVDSGGELGAVTRRRDVKPGSRAAADWPSDHVSLFVHVPPESADVQMYPLSAVAASLVPSLDDVMPLHPCPIRSASPVGVQLTPESIDV